MIQTNILVVHLGIWNFIGKYQHLAEDRYEKWDHGQLTETKLERFPLRWYGVEEFKMILEKVGFEDIVIAADYKHGNYPTNVTQTITFEAIANK